VAYWIEDRWEWLHGCWGELQHICQAISFLTEPDKQQLSLQEIGNDICPLLTTHQLYRLTSMFNDDEGGTQGVSSEVGIVNVCHMLR
jgi:myosin-5